MKQTITKSMFRDEFRNCGRAEQFSYEGLGALYDWLEDVHGEDWELDVIALCCEFAESTYDEIRDDYRNKFEAEASDDEVLNALHAETVVVWEGEGRVLYQQF